METLEGAGNKEEDWMTTTAEIMMEIFKENHPILKKKLINS